MRMLCVAHGGENGSVAMIDVERRRTAKMSKARHIKTFGMLPGAMRGLSFDRRVEAMLVDRDDVAPIVRPCSRLGDNHVATPLGSEKR
jgi:hypothetical protein